VHLPRRLHQSDLCRFGYMTAGEILTLQQLAGRASLGKPGIENASESGPPVRGLPRNQL